MEIVLIPRRKLENNRARMKADERKRHWRFSAMVALSRTETFFLSRGLSVFRITKSEKWSNGQGQFVLHGRYS
jgi:hypothetical protein